MNTKIHNERQNINKDSGSEEQCSKAKITLFQKQILAAICSILILFAALVAPNSVMRAKRDPFSGDIVIQECAKQQLYKHYLKDEDFAKITKLNLTESPSKFQQSQMRQTDITDIKLLRKFSNLQELDLSLIRFPDTRIPKWMKYLDKIGILDIKKKFAIDLEPLKYLSDLKSLHLSSAQIYDISPLKDLANLEELYIDYTQVSDLEPLKGLTKLSTLCLTGCENITVEQVEDLQKALPNLKIIRSVTR